jgi:hypothetical protein
MLKGIAGTAGLVFALASCAAAQGSGAAAPKQAEARSAPHERMAFFEGTWELEPGGFPASIARDAGRHETCSWLAGARRHILCRTSRESAGGSRDSIYVLSYSEHDKKYVAWFAFQDGQNLLYHGTLDGDRWIMELQPTPVVPSRLRLRTTVTPTESGMRFVEEGSNDGGAWEVGEDYRYKRVTADRPAPTSAARPAAEPAKGPSSPSAPHERLAFFEGRWEFETATTPEVSAKRMGRRETCEWLAGGRRHMVCTQTSKSADGISQESLYILSYRERDSTYLAYFAIPGGENVIFHGTPTEDGWVMELQPTPLVPKGLRMRTTITRTAGGLRFLDESSMDGAPWQLMEDYQHKRTK